jgi:hypothetical protein
MGTDWGRCGSGGRRIGDDRGRSPLVPPPARRRARPARCSSSTARSSSPRCGPVSGWAYAPRAKPASGLGLRRPPTTPPTPRRGPRALPVDCAARRRPEPVRPLRIRGRPGHVPKGTDVTSCTESALPEGTAICGVTVQQVQTCSEGDGSSIRSVRGRHQPHLGVAHGGGQVPVVMQAGNQGATAEGGTLQRCRPWTSRPGLVPVIESCGQRSSNDRDDYGHAGRSAARVPPPAVGRASASAPWGSAAAAAPRGRGAGAVAAPPALRSGRPPGARRARADKLSLLGLPLPRGMTIDGIYTGTPGTRAGI